MQAAVGGVDRKELVVIVYTEENKPVCDSPVVSPPVCPRCPCSAVPGVRQQSCEQSRGVRGGWADRGAA